MEPSPFVLRRQRNMWMSSQILQVELIAAARKSVKEGTGEVSERPAQTISNQANAVEGLFSKLFLDINLEQYRETAKSHTFLGHELRNVEISLASLSDITVLMWAGRAFIQLSISHNVVSREVTVSWDLAYLPPRIRILDIFASLPQVELFTTAVKLGYEAGAEFIYDPSIPAPEEI